MIKSIEVKPCNTCVHYRKPNICKMFPPQVDVVLGKYNTMNVYNARYNSKLCGIEGKHYEMKSEYEEDVCGDEHVIICSQEGCSVIVRKGRSNYVTYDTVEMVNDIY